MSKTPELVLKTGILLISKKESEKERKAMSHFPCIQQERNTILQMKQ